MATELNPATFATWPDPATTLLLALAGDADVEAERVRQERAAAAAERAAVVWYLRDTWGRYVHAAEAIAKDIERGKHRDTKPTVSTVTAGPACSGCGTARAGAP